MTLEMSDGIDAALDRFESRSGSRRDHPGRLRRTRALRRRRHSRPLGEFARRRRSRRTVLAPGIRHECADREISEAVCGVHGWAGDGRRRRSLRPRQPSCRHRSHQARDARGRARLLPRCRRHLAAVALARRDRHLFRSDRPDHERARRDPRKICRRRGAGGQMAGAARGTDQGSRRRDRGRGQQAHQRLCDRRGRGAGRGKGADHRRTVRLRPHGRHLRARSSATAPSSRWRRSRRSTKNRRAAWW